jgi:hypothetical protein
MTWEALDEGREAFRKARVPQRQRLIEALAELAQFYVANECDDPRLGMEAMCEDFFRIVAEGVYPDGWGGLLAKAMRQAG